MKHRLFIAITPPQSFKVRVSALQLDLDNLGLPVRWEEPEKLHLTLSLLARVSDEQMSHINALLRCVSSRTTPLEISPLFLETLYQKHEPSLIYLGLAGDITALKGLYSQLYRELTEMGFPQRKRFLPHITVGRLKKADPALTKKFLDRLDGYQFSPPDAFTVNSLDLYRSLISRAGSTYQLVNRFPL